MMRKEAICLLAVTLMVSVAAAAEPPAPPLPTAKPVLTPQKIDELVAADIEKFAGFVLVDDEQFLRRASLDIIGRQPTPEEMRDFLVDLTSKKRDRAIDRLLENKQFGNNWANYWSDTISHHVVPPELTFLNYVPLKKWLAARLNDGSRWDAVVSEILTGTGKIKDHPPATFVAYHQGHATKLAAETARVFLGLQIQCAECHDHPFDTWKREQFHQLAAFFARSSVKMPWNEGIETVVSDKGKGEYVMPDAADPRKKGKSMDPAFLNGKSVGAGKSDLERRRELSRFITSRENEWFAKSFVNRVWSRLMGHGFYEPVDNIGQFQPQLLENVHEELTTAFRDSGYDVRLVFRLIMKTSVYQQQLSDSKSNVKSPFAAAQTTKLQGDQVFQSLVTAIELPNVTPAQQKSTDAERFPPPPKSTRDLIADVFNYDPSRKPTDVSRTMSQAMLLMNNKQLTAQINAKPGSGTVLSQLLERQSDDKKVVERLFALVFARKPTAKEISISLEHIKQVNDRGPAFEDLLWGLINSTEFTTKR